MTRECVADAQIPKLLESFKGKTGSFKGKDLKIQGLLGEKQGERTKSISKGFRVMVCVAWSVMM